MNRIFHARIAVGQYLFIILAGAMAVYGLWEKNILIAVLFMLLLVVSIEKLIHTTYTVTADNRLLLFFGRFSRGHVPGRFSVEIGGNSPRHNRTVRASAQILLAGGSDNSHRHQSRAKFFHIVIL